MEKVSEITWIPKEKIIQAARLFAIDTPGVIQIGSSIGAAGQLRSDLEGDYLPDGHLRQHRKARAAW